MSFKFVFPLTVAAITSAVATWAKGSSVPSYVAVCPTTLDASLIFKGDLTEALTLTTAEGTSKSYKHYLWTVSPSGAVSDLPSGATTPCGGKGFVNKYALEEDGGACISFEDAVAAPAQPSKDQCEYTYRVKGSDSPYSAITIYVTCDRSATNGLSFRGPSGSQELFVTKNNTVTNEYTSSIFGWSASVCGNENTTTIPATTASPTTTSPDTTKTPRPTTTPAPTFIASCPNEFVPHFSIEGILPETVTTKMNGKTISETRADYWWAVNPSWPASNAPKNASAVCGGGVPAFIAKYNVTGADGGVCVEHDTVAIAPGYPRYDTCIYTYRLGKSTASDGVHDRWLYIWCDPTMAEDAGIDTFGGFYTTIELSTGEKSSSMSARSALVCGNKNTTEPPRPTLPPAPSDGTCPPTIGAFAGSVEATVITVHGDNPEDNTTTKATYSVSVSPTNLTKLLPPGTTNACDGGRPFFVSVFNTTTGECLECLSDRYEAPQPIPYNNGCGFTFTGANRTSDLELPRVIVSVMCDEAVTGPMVVDNMSIAIVNTTALGPHNFTQIVGRSAFVCGGGGGDGTTTEMDESTTTAVDTQTEPIETTDDDMATTTSTDEHTSTTTALPPTTTFPVRTNATFVTSLSDAARLVDEIRRAIHLGSNNKAAAAASDSSDDGDDDSITAECPNTWSPDGNRSCVATFAAHDEAVRAVDAANSGQITNVFSAALDNDRPTTTATAPAADDDDTSNFSSKKGLIIGITVGAIAVAAVGVVVSLFLRRRKRQTAGDEYLNADVQSMRGD